MPVWAGELRDDRVGFQHDVFDIEAYTDEETTVFVNDNERPAVEFLGSSPPGASGAVTDFNLLTFYSIISSLRTP